MILKSELRFLTKTIVISTFYQQLLDMHSVVIKINLTYTNLQLIFFYKPAIIVRPPIRFDVTCSQFDWTKKEFQYNKITLEKSVFTII